MLTKEVVAPPAATVNEPHPSPPISDLAPASAVNDAPPDKEGEAKPQKAKASKATRKPPVPLAHPTYAECDRAIECGETSEEEGSGRVIECGETSVKEVTAKVETSVAKMAEYSAKILEEKRPGGWKEEEKEEKRPYGGNPFSLASWTLEEEVAASVNHVRVQVIKAVVAGEEKVATPKASK